jgi:hypothetical protein
MNQESLSAPLGLNLSIGRRNFFQPKPIFTGILIRAVIVWQLLTIVVYEQRLSKSGSKKLWVRIHHDIRSSFQATVIWLLCLLKLTMPTGAIIGHGN